MPIERVSQAFKDISMTFQSNPLNDDLIAIKNENAIARSLRNIVFTLPGEKFFNQSFGSRITESLFESFLQTTDLPPVDLLIRTGNSRRISNFLLWQVAYAEIYFSKLYWPDFGAEDVDNALAEYAQTQRTFGLVPETMISSTEAR